MEQERWLRENSPYRYHKSRKSEFCCKDCCGQQPEPTDCALRHHHPEQDAMIWFPLYQCPVCSAYYIPLEQQWKKIEHLLRYERKSL